MIQISETIVENLSAKGVLAYVAVNVAGCGVYSTAALASAVHCSTAAMREGMQNLEDNHPEVVKWVKKEKKWFVGGMTNPVGAIQEQSERRQQFIEDLKKYWDHLNPNLAFSFGQITGTQVGLFLRRNPRWERKDWRQALNNRTRSEGLVRTMPIASVVKSLEMYAAGPLDRYGKALEFGGAAHGKALGIEAANRAARQVITAANGV